MNDVNGQLVKDSPPTRMDYWGPVHRSGQSSDVLCCHRRTARRWLTSKKVTMAVQVFFNGLKVMAAAEESIAWPMYSTGRFSPGPLQDERDNAQDLTIRGGCRCAKPREASCAGRKGFNMPRWVGF